MSVVANDPFKSKDKQGGSFLSDLFNILTPKFIRDCINNATKNLLSYRDWQEAGRRAKMEWIIRNAYLPSSENNAFEILKNIDLVLNDEENIAYLQSDGSISYEDVLTYFRNLPKEKQAALENNRIKYQEALTSEERLEAFNSAKKEMWDIDIAEYKKSEEFQEERQFQIDYLINERLPYFGLDSLSKSERFRFI